MAINYGAEPLWFRFGMAQLAAHRRSRAAMPRRTCRTPTRPSRTCSRRPRPGHAGLHRRRRSAGPHAPPPAHGIDPRLLLHPPRPRVAARALRLPGLAKDGLAGKCLATGFFPTLAGEVGSRAIGHEPARGYTGAQDLIQPGSHFTLSCPARAARDAVRATTCSWTGPASARPTASGRCSGCSDHAGRRRAPESWRSPSRRLVAAGSARADAPAAGGRRRAGRPRRRGGGLHHRALGAPRGAGRSSRGSTPTCGSA